MDPFDNDKSCCIELYLLRQSDKLDDYETHFFMSEQALPNINSGRPAHDK